MAVYVNIIKETHDRFAAAGRMAFSQGESLDKAVAKVEQSAFYLLLSETAQQEIYNALAQGWFDSALAHSKAKVPA